ncbi:MAG: hypothetical protein WD768_09905 [Phycisphaeraceae bacterium]
MFQFLTRLFGFALLQGGLLLLVFVVKPMDKAYFSMTNQKHVLAESIPSPRIIIAGGSNTLALIDGKDLREGTGYHPISMGLYFGVGLDFMLAEAADVARPGDVLLLSLEPEHFSDPRSENDTLMQLVLTRPDNARYLPLSYMRFFGDNFLDMFFQFTGNRFRALLRRNKGKYIVDEFGILKYPDTAPSPYETPDLNTRRHMPIDPALIDAQIDKINRVVRECNANGVRVVLVMSPFDEAIHRFDAAFFKVFEKHLAERYEGILLARPEESLWPAEYFFDSPHHLNHVGRARHTQMLIDRWKLLPPPAP